MEKYNFVFEGDDTYKWGSNTNGIGIYVEDEKYFGNIVFEGDVTIGFGPYETMEYAKNVLTKEFENRK